MELVAGWVTDLARYFESSTTSKDTKQKIVVCLSDECEKCCLFCSIEHEIKTVDLKFIKVDSQTSTSSKFEKLMAEL